MGICNINGHKDLKEKLESGEVIRCAKCGAIFEEDDGAFAVETGECQYCHELMEKGLTK